MVETGLRISRCKRMSRRTRRSSSGAFSQGFGPLGGTVYTSTEKGGIAEGWGASALDSNNTRRLVQYNNNIFGKGTGPGLAVTRDNATGAFVSATTTSSVPGAFNITQTFTPAAVTGVFRVRTTILNIGAAPITDVRYKRVMDWDIDPTPFMECVTIDWACGLGATGAGGNCTKPTALAHFDTNGFASAEPVTVDANPTPFIRAGPQDQGAQLTFKFGTLAAGDSTTFNVFYGAAANESGAYAAIAAAGMEIYTLGLSSINGACNRNAPTFIYGFAGVGGCASKVTFASSGEAAPAFSQPIRPGALTTLRFTPLYGATCPGELVCQVTWGDGTPAETVPCAKGGAQVSAAHAYAAPGSYSASVRAFVGGFEATTASTLVNLPESVASDPSALSALFPAALAAAANATLVTVPVEVAAAGSATADESAPAISCTAAFLDSFRAELAARANLSVALLSSITCTALGLAPAPSRRQLLRRSLDQQQAPLSAWAGGACPQNANASGSALGLTVTLRLPTGLATADEVAAIRQRLLAALEAWASAGGTDVGGAALSLCGPSEERVSTTVEVAVTTRVTLTAAGVAVLAGACNGTAAVGMPEGSTCTVIRLTSVRQAGSEAGGGSSSSSSGPSAGVIAGATVGAVVGALLLALLLVALARAVLNGGGPSQQPAGPASGATAQVQVTTAA
ncbi:hypothetical protein HYH03_012212 [Edaphochlamys debaryana]|uniref:PKD domain-containing protein n=1 Tax=Edaphochlamys debaryana TaxID=47281 RepID=A0A835XTI0_9CHLO|nr:hypothetical protein HYH03_012212 [Edaphochlamys debaryana]|eukprot:KAG2489382.1 hypothetical protein HYH03_012212 [Edaphochlamys debaryana]